MKRKLFIILLLSMFLCACNKTEEPPAPTIAPTVTQVPTPEPTIAPEPTVEPEPTPTELPEEVNISKCANIPFEENQMYAVAYLGYGYIENMDYYLENYLDEENVPHYYFSGDEFYLIIPRYEEMEIRLYRNDLATMGKTLEQECEAGRPFTLQCNVSDIFQDVTVELTYNGETVEFSPYISLKDGSVQVGERGINITRMPDYPWTGLTEEEIRWFNDEFFNSDTDGDFKRNNFLNCTYEDVKDISIYDIFYNSSADISKEERNALRGSEIDVGVDYQKLTVKFIDSILNKHMRITLDKVANPAMDRYLYLEEFDAYYGSHGDTNYSPVEVKSGEVNEDGTIVKLRYLRTEDRKEYIVTLLHYYDDYYFMSNVEVE
ncbi:MAG: hypothetical protein J6K15_04010 [Lachnospiraceae bacterium]|nr:hypothetical protein [Lachnospiraceae bacterium]